MAKDGDRLRSSAAPVAVVLLSGGMDSAVTALAARRLGYELHGLSFAYGQRHAVELRRAAELAAALGFAEHRTVAIEPFSSGASALTEPGAPIPHGREVERLGSEPIPPTYVPARNTIFLAHALALAELRGAADVFLGVNALDYSGYPDCRPEYLAAFAAMAALATRAGVELGRPLRLRAPLLHRTKAEIVRLGVELELDFSRTWSCYDPQPGPGSEPLPCGACDSCRLRRKGFAEAGVEDPQAPSGALGQGRGR